MGHGRWGLGLSDGSVPSSVAFSTTIPTIVVIVIVVGVVIGGIVIIATTIVGWGYKKYRLGRAVDGPHDT